MTDQLISKAEQHAYQQLFLHDLHWSAPDHPPIEYSEDGHTLTATNISSYKGLRVWVCDQKPGSKLEAHLDREIAKTSTDRLVIFHDGADQVWRWPVRRNNEHSTTTRLTSHKHRTGDPDPRFAAKLDAIRLPIDIVLDPNAVLAKVRSAFDVEAQNETKHASKLMARMYAAMEKAYAPGHDRAAREHQISVTLARILFLMFGDDTDMWPPDLFRDFIHQHTAADGSDIGHRLSVLFAYLDTPPADRGGTEAEFTDFRYVNGRIFSERIILPAINADFRTVILEACDRDWATISPAIFGSMFQSVRDAQTRRELGEHYTSEENILKTLNPLFLDDLRAEYEKAVARDTDRKQINALGHLRERLGRITFMDPACGCGNFIIIAYRELRDLELSIMERLQEITGDSEMLLANVGLKVTLDHFYGIEIDEWPAKIAETAMFLMDRQCDLKLTERLGWAPDRLPIQTQATIVAGTSALTLNWAKIMAPTNEAIVAGNPPFFGHKERTEDQGKELRAAWHFDAVQHLDYVTAWYAKTLDYFKGHEGLWAFVSTNSVAQGESVPKLFGAIFNDGWRIKFAHRTFGWSSEASGAAVVHVVIIGFAKDCPKPRLFEYAHPKSPPVEVEVGYINGYLVDGPNVLVEGRRTVLSTGLPEIKAGSTAIDWNHLTVAPDQLDIVRADRVAAKYLRRYMGGKELIHNIERWCLWMDVAEFKPGDIQKSTILATRLRAVREKRAHATRRATQQLASTPHLFGEIRQPSVPYLGMPQTFSETRRYATAARLPLEVIASIKLFTAPDSDGFLFAVFSSSMFITWQKTVGGRIKSDPSFSSSVVWNNFPLPPITSPVRRQIIEGGKAVLVARDLHPERTLAQHYDPATMDPRLVAAHERLDELVDHGFGAKAKCQSERERQQILFARYEELTSPLLAAASNTRRRR
jgi:hypothetical protein